jgi:hypothetical protein
MLGYRIFDGNRFFREYTPPTFSSQSPETPALRRGVLNSVDVVFRRERRNFVIRVRVRT